MSLLWGCGDDGPSKPGARSLVVATYPATTQGTPTPSTTPLEPATPPAGVNVTREVPYNETSRLDIYAPKTPGRFPTVVMYPGNNSDKVALSNLAGAVASSGAVVFAVTYRGRDDQVAIVADARCAAWYAAANSNAYGGDGGPIVLVGVSTGAHLAFGEGFAGPWRSLALEFSCKATEGGSIRAVVGVVGAYNTIEQSSAEYATFSPFSQVSASPQIPVRLVEGVKDRLQIDRAGTVAFRDALVAAGHPVTATFVDDIPNLALVGLKADSVTGQLAPLGLNEDRRGLELAAREVLAAAQGT